MRLPWHMRVTGLAQPRAARSTLSGQWTALGAGLSGGTVKRSIAGQWPWVLETCSHSGTHLGQARSGGTAALHKPQSQAQSTHFFAVLWKDNITGLLPACLQLGSLLLKPVSSLQPSLHIPHPKWTGIPKPFYALSAYSRIKYLVLWPCHYKLHPISRHIGAFEPSGSPFSTNYTLQYRESTGLKIQISSKFWLETRQISKFQANFRLKLGKKGQKS